MNKPLNREELVAYKGVEGLTLLPLNGKRPCDTGWPVKTYNRADVLRTCADAALNVGVRLSDSWLILDIDPRNGGEESFTRLCAELGLDMADVPTVITGGGGRHYYMRKPPGLKIVDTLADFPGLDFKSTNRRQVVAAGSIHPETGRHYEWDIGTVPLQEAPAAPAALLALIARPERAAASGDTAGSEYTPEQLRDALERLNVESFRDQAEWLTLMMACHHATGGEGRQEFIDWSTSDPKYANDAEIIGRRWDSLHAAKPGGVTFRTLNKILADHGAQQLPPVVPPDEFGPLDPEDEARLEGVMPFPKLAHVNASNIDTMFKVVNLNGKVRVLYWGKSPLDRKVRVPQFWSYDEFRKALANKTVTFEMKGMDKNGEEKVTERVMPLADWWLRKRDRYTYDGVVLEAEQDSHSDTINLFRGFGVKESEAGSWDKLREHIRNIIANGDEESYQYILRWIAWALQHPCDPCEVALILKSVEHGTGKGVFLRALRKLFGVHGMQINKSGLLTGRFNAHLAMTCLLFVDEMTLGDNKETATLNSTLTEDTLTIEPKGVDAYMMPNHVKVVAASNQEHVVYIANSDRRFAVFEVSSKRARDAKYFAAIVEELEAGGYGRMLYDLLRMDLNGWHPRQGIPHNAAKVREKVESAAPELQWLAAYLDSGVLDCQIDRRGGVVVAASDFYTHARRTVMDLRGWSDNRFASFLKKWGATRRRSMGLSQWEFPPLARMRAEWRKQMPWWPDFDQTVSEWCDCYTDQEEDMDFG